MTVRVSDSSKDIIDEFSSGNVVFKIIALGGGSMRDVHMVVGNEDYERDLYDHQYTPMLFVLSFYERLAYLYGCFNRSFRNERDETFIFRWRRVGTDSWYDWFEVEPKMDEIYS